MKIQGRRRLQSSRARTRRIDRVFLRITQCVLVTFFLFTVSSMLSHHPSVQISHVNVFDAEATSIAQAKSTAEVLLAQSFLGKILRNNALLYPKKDIANAIYALDAHIEHVSVDVDPHTDLNIRIKEFTPALLWCAPAILPATTSDPCFLADKKGYIYARAPLYSGYPFPIFRTDIAGAEEEGSPIGLYLLPEGEFMRIEEFRHALRLEGIFVHAVSHVEGQDYDFVTDEGLRVLWSTNRDAKESAKNASSALFEMQQAGKLKQESPTPNIIDLRFENKVFYQ